ncbi:nitrate assimilation regulatory protein nirA [Paramyrothecium foliicola]|nr:nitrate assimilation regulatory protein nirA [Paramyrothecium foliicola]
MTGSRPILPRPPPGDTSATLNGEHRLGGGRRLGRKKVERISQACECDGLRPVCSPCTLRKASCEYVSPTGLSKLELATSRLEVYGALFETLKNGTSEQREALLEQIQSTEDIFSLAQLDINEPKLVPTLHAASEPSSQEAFTPSEKLEPMATVTAVHPEELQITQRSIVAKIELPDVTVARGAVDYFFEATSRLFQVFSPASVDRHLDSVYSGATVPYVEKMISTACLAAVAAVGCQYSNDEFDQVTEVAFYDTSRHCLDLVIEYSPLDAIGICSLLVLYNTMSKGTVALSYVEMGLSMARMQGLYEKKCPHNEIPKSKWLAYRKTWRALVFFSCFLGATLGYVSGNDTMFDVRISEMNIDDSQDMEDIVQAELTKISILKVTVLRLHMAFKDISELTVESILGDLSRWYDELPPQMQLENLNGADLAVGLRRTIYYAHLLHLGAIMLVYRLIAYKAQRVSAIDQHTEDPVDICFHRFAYRGVMAAKRSARILDLLLTDIGVFRRCWLVMFQSYTSCLTILHTVVQEQLHGVSRAVWEENLELTSKCLSVLEYCGRMDPVAAKFHQSLTGYYDRVAHLPLPGVMELSREATMTVEAMSTAASEDGGYLLHIPPNADPRRAALAKELLRLVCVPFGDPETKVYSEELARTPGWRPDPTCYEHPQLIERLNFKAETEARRHDALADGLIEQLRRGGGRPALTNFLGSPEPHGWSLGGFPPSF